MFEANLAAYLAAAAFIMAVPGPANMLIMSRGASSFAAGAHALVGLMAANALLLAAAIIGVSSLVLASQPAFIALKWIGATYLLFLGVGFWRHVRRNEPLPAPTGRGVFDGFLAGVSNPKALIFYFAFLPQFVTDNTSAQLQLIGLGIVDLTLVAIIFGAYAWVGSFIIRFLGRSGVRAFLDRCAGGVMIISAAAILRTARPTS